MPSRGPFPRLPWAALAAWAAFGWAGGVRAELAPSSPFLPANAVAGGASGAPAGPVELRGIMGIPGGYAYCIYDTTKKTSAWVGLNERGNDFVVKAADPAKESVTVDFQGRSLQLVLRTSKVASAGAAPGPSAASAVASSVVVNPSMADEQRRLDAVAQEVRRRRLERERAVQNTAPASSNTPAPGPNR